MAKGSYEDTFTKYREQFEQKLDAIREQILQKAEEDISEGAGDDEEVDVSEAEEILIDFDDAYGDLQTALDAMQDQISRLD